MKAIRSLQPKASTRPASSARQPARSSFEIEWSCCWSRHHSMREMMLLGSYFMISSNASITEPILYNGIRNWGDALSGESSNLLRGKTCKGRWTDLDIHSDMPVLYHA